MHQRVGQPKSATRLGATRLGGSSSGGSGGGGMRTAAASALLRASSSGSEGEDDEWEPGAYGLVDVTPPKQRLTTAAARGGGSSVHRQGQPGRHAGVGVTVDCTSNRTSHHPTLQVASPLEHGTARQHIPSGCDGSTSTSGCPLPSPGSPRRAPGTPAGTRAFSFGHPSPAAARHVGAHSRLMSRQASGQMRSGLGAAPPQRQAPAAPPFDLTLDDRADSAAFGSEFNAPI